MTLQLGSLSKSLTALEDILTVSGNDQRMGQLSDIERVAIRAGAVRHFEITYELCWKLIARWLNATVSRGIADGVTKRQLFRLAAENRLISDVERWMGHHKGRSETRHIYEHERAEAVYRAATDFAPDARSLLGVLKSRND